MNGQNYKISDVTLRMKSCASDITAVKHFILQFDATIPQIILRLGLIPEAELFYGTLLKYLHGVRVAHCYYES